MRPRNRRGTAAVEVAVCLPVIVAVMLGSIEMSAGIFQQHGVRAVLHECARVAAKGENDGLAVQSTAQQMLGQIGFSQFTIQINVVPRTQNIGSTDPPTVTNFTIPSSGSPTAGLENVPRGTVLRIDVTAPRPAISGIGLARILNPNVTANCVFVKEV